jgi:UPF0716 family protein affecting phage T7 exclusion
VIAMNEPQIWAVIGVLSATLIAFATALIGFLNSRIAGIQRELDIRFAALERQLDARFDVLDRDVQAIAGRVFGTDRD